MGNSLLITIWLLNSGLISCNKYFYSIILIYNLKERTCLKHTCDVIKTENILHWLVSISRLFIKVRYSIALQCTINVVYIAIDTQNHMTYLSISGGWSDKVLGKKGRDFLRFLQLTRKENHFSTLEIIKP